jgi:hypothetical protein
VGWGELMADCEREIAATSARVKKLKAALKIFRESKEQGVPFPLDEEKVSTQN